MRRIKLNEKYIVDTVDNIFNFISPFAFENYSSPGNSVTIGSTSYHSQLFEGEDEWRRVGEAIISSTVTRIFLYLYF